MASIARSVSGWKNTSRSSSSSPGQSRSSASTRSFTAASDGGRNRGRTIIADSGLTSLPHGTRPRSTASSGVVPRPMNGSSTRSPGWLSRSMKNAGSDGLKHAR